MLVSAPRMKEEGTRREGSEIARVDGEEEGESEGMAAKTLVPSEDSRVLGVVPLPSLLLLVEIRGRDEEEREEEVEREGRVRVGCWCSSSVGEGGLAVEGWVL